MAWGGGGFVNMHASLWLACIVIRILTFRSYLAVLCYIKIKSKVIPLQARCGPEGA